MKLSINTPDIPVKEGLQDGIEYTLCCSNCGKASCNIKVTRPDVDHVWRARATCAYGCKKSDGTPEMSFPETIKGLARYAGCFIEREDKQDIIMTTSINDIREDSDTDGPIITYITLKR